MFSFLLKLKRRIKRLFRVQSESRQVVVSTPRSRFLKYAMLVVVGTFIGVLYPAEYIYDPLDMPRKGEISQEDIIAPFQITVLKSKRELSEEKDVSRLAVPFVVDCDTLVLGTVLSSLDRLFVLTDSLQLVNDTSRTFRQRALASLSQRFPRMSQTVLIQLLSDTNLVATQTRLNKTFTEQIYHLGVLPDNAVIPESPNKSVLIKKGERGSIHIRDNILQVATANARLLATLNQMYVSDSFDVEYHYKIGQPFVRANLTPNQIAYEDQIELEVALVSEVKLVVDQGDIILRSGQKVTAQKEQIIREMARLIRGQAANRSPLLAYLPTIGRVVLVTAVLGLMYFFLYFFRREVFVSNAKLLAIFVAFSLQLFIVYLVNQAGLSGYLYPVAFLPILLTILFDSHLGILATIILALMLGLMHRFDFEIVLMTTVVGMTATFASQRVRRRANFFRIIVITAISYVAYIGIIENLKLISDVDILLEMGYGIVNGILSVFLVIGLVPIFESIFSITTDITLLELSDMNHPLLKRLAMEAPGTYHHSIIVGNLTEAAAKAIGGNSLLARVGAYYHDIGKIEIPEYFVENQLGIKSKHEMLTPSMSSIILSSHVKKGRILGELHDIPDDILNFIEEHHGTMVQMYFYNKATEEAGQDVDVNKFRYPGPKPQIRETGITMLADAVEAASRTLENPKPARINNLIQRIIDDRFKSGELDECPLTLRDLAKIKDAFSQVLIGAFHHRIAYPKKDGEDD